MFILFSHAHLIVSVSFLHIWYLYYILTMTINILCFFSYKAIFRPNQEATDEQYLMICLFVFHIQAHHWGQGQPNPRFPGRAQGQGRAVRQASPPGRRRLRCPGTGKVRTQCPSPDSALLAGAAGHRGPLWSWAHWARGWMQVQGSGFRQEFRV